MATTSSLATVWLMMIRMFEREGLDPAELLAGLGISAEQLAEPGKRFPSRIADIVFERACPRLSDPAFALHAARCWHPSNLGTMGYAWLSSSTLRTGLKRLERYARILGERFRYTVQESADGLRFVYDHGRGDKAIGPFMTDFSLSIIIDMCRTNFGDTFTPLQVAAIAALEGDQQCVRDIAQEYRHRRDVLVKGLHEAGWMVECPKASMYVWAKIPEPYASMGSLEFAKKLLGDAKVCVSPGIGFGDYGDTHVRFALIENADRIRQAVRGIKAMFRADGLLPATKSASSESYDK